MFTEIHEDYYELPKEGVETEDPARSGSIADKTDLRSGIYTSIYSLKQEKRAFSFPWFQTISDVRMMSPL